MTKFLVDNNLPPTLVDWLGKHGRDAVHVKSVKLANESDAKVWNYAQTNSLSIITKDTDFDRFALQAPTLIAPVFRLVIGNATKAQLFTWLEGRLHLLGGTGVAGKLAPDLILTKLIIVE